MFFEDVRLPASALLGKENQGFYMLMQVQLPCRGCVAVCSTIRTLTPPDLSLSLAVPLQELPQERLLIAGMATAAAEAAFEWTREYGCCLCWPLLLVLLIAHVSWWCAQTCKEPQSIWQESGEPAGLLKSL